MKRILRWIISVPIAALCSCIVFNIFDRLNMTLYQCIYKTSHKEVGDVTYLLIDALGNAIAFAIFIMVCVSIVPTYKKYVNKILCAILCLFIGVPMIADFFISFSIENLIQQVFTIGGILIGFGYEKYQLKMDYE